MQPPIPHNFGAVLAGGSAGFTYVAGNIGGATLIGSAATPCVGFSVGTTALDLDPGETTNLLVIFAPPGPGTFTCQLVVNSNGGNVAIDLIGGGREAAPIPLIGSPVDPAGLMMIGLFAAATVWAMRRRVG